MGTDDFFLSQWPQTIPFLRGVVIPLIFPKVPQSSQTESLGFPQLPPSPWTPPLRTLQSNCCQQVRNRWTSSKIKRSFGGEIRPQLGVGFCFFFRSQPTARCFWNHRNRFGGGVDVCPKKRQHRETKHEANQKAKHIFARLPVMLI